MAFDWKQVLGAVAPVLGTALGGPFGAMAGGLVNAALGLDQDADEAARIEALKKATPDQFAAIQQAEQQFKLDMERLNIDVLRLDADDRKNAREREIKVRDLTPMLLAGLIVLGWALLNWHIFTTALPGENKDFLLRSLGTIDAAVTLVLSYYFGSSAGSAAKDKIIAGAK